MIITILALGAAMQAVTDAQWATGRIQDRDPVASFLSWDYSSVILRAGCRGQEVVITYYGDQVVPHDPPETVLIVDDAVFKMRRTGPAEYVLDADGVAGLQQGRWVEFDAPNEMGEPWYLGEAHALKNLAAVCSGATS
jgi:hypothetical protein